MSRTALEVLAANLKLLSGSRKEMKSQAAIGAAAKIDQRTVGRIMNKEHEPTLLQLTKLAKAFRLEPWQLLVLDIEPSHPPMLAKESEGLRRLLANIGRTKEALDGFLSSEGSTASGDLD